MHILLMNYIYNSVVRFDSLELFVPYVIIQLCNDGALLLLDRTSGDHLPNLHEYGYVWV